ncbi:esterase [Streptomyces sp. NRRL F-5755]|uniref:alpha/beta fold hydrolase n=1 Tax=Streptomyces sp. NRRL F-5755 TaxID=1519475 RepID=UPI0006ADEE57|nr:alpha/beta hydrolase [Streptomyces sp. NRRL F-5755]KOT95011.1 esterase [Streptomyces sp. NRRL F-5755]
MVNYVLVAGAWLGAWVWDEVVPLLRAAGHGAYPLTLSGLADKQGVPAGQQTHVEDIVGEVDRLGLDNVVLVGHSYSGIPVGQAAEQIGDRLSRVIFVDSDVPVDGKSFVSGWPDVRAAVEASIAETGGFWAPPAAAGYAGHGLTDEQIEHMVDEATPHPGATLTEPAELAGSLAELPATYIKCVLDGPEPIPAVAKLLTSEKRRLVELETGHWPMLSAPGELARILLDAAER